MDNSHREGISHQELIAFRLQDAELWRLELTVMEYYANYPQYRKAFDASHPAP